MVSQFFSIKNFNFDIVLWCLFFLLIPVNYLVGASELHKASAHGHIERVKLILSKKVNINEVASDPKSNEEWPKGTPLHWASVYGHLSVVQVLLKKGANPNAFTSIGDGSMNNTPLDFAVGEGHSKIVDVLLSTGAYVEGTKQDFRWPFEHALRIEQIDIANILLKYGADIYREDFEGNSVLHRVILNEKIKSVKYLIDSVKMNFNYRNPISCETPLHTAAYIGNEDIVKYLLNKGAKVNIQDCGGKTPLMVAEENGYNKIVSLIRSKSGKRCRIESTD